MPAGRLVRTATIVVTDLVDSTATFLGMTPAAAEDLRRRHDEVLGDIVAVHDGQVLKNLGDGLLLRFDAAGAGIAAGVAMQQAMTDLAAEAAMDLRMRVGISIGDVSWEPSDAFGRPVVEAARLCSAATPSGILVTRAVALCAVDAVDVGPEVELRLKGFDEPVAAHAVTWEAATDTGIPLPAGLEVAPTLIGRDAEVAELRDRWAEATAGASVAIAVGGEPGIGKSSLLADLARHAHGGGAVVLHGRCYQGSLAPHRPLVDALGPAIDLLSPLELRRAAGTQATELTRLFPDLHERLPGLPLPGRNDAATERQRLFDAVASFVTGLAARRPVLLVVDDLQWADEGTAQLVRHVIAERPPGVAVVVAHRAGEDQPEHGAAAALAEVGRQGGTRLVLAGLDLDGVVALAERGLGGGGRVADADDLLRRTGGNPFALHEVVAALAEGREELPPRVRDVLQERIGRTPARTQEALAAVAVAGREATLALVADVLDVDVDGPVGALAAVEAALAAGLLVELPGGGRFRCAHDLVRSTAYELQTATRRARRHLAVAEHLERRVPDHDPSEVARHLDVAVTADPGLSGRAARAWLAASVDARGRLAYELARVAAERGLAIIASAAAHVAGDLALEPALQQALADASFCLGDYRAASQAGTRAAQAAHHRGLVDLRAEALVGLARIENQGQPDPYLASALEDLLDEPDLAPPLRVRVLAAAARYLAWSEGRVAEARELADAAVAQAESLQDVEASRAALWAWVVANEGSSDPEARVAVGARLIALADAHHDDESRAIGHFVRAMARLELGKRLAFDDDVTDFEAVARRRGGRFEVSNAASFRRLQHGSTPISTRSRQERVRCWGTGRTTRRS
jgi:class 3 adenylate cyclase